MANVYVYSGAAGAGTGADWANAYTTLAAALTAKAAGDIFYVADDHAETQATAMTLTSPGSSSNPCTIACVLRSGGSVPPVSADLRTTAVVSTTGASNITFSGKAHCHGIIFQAGSGANNASLLLSGASGSWHLTSCLLELVGTGSSSRIQLGSNGAVSEWVLDNTPMKFSSTSHGVTIGQTVTWRNTANAIQGTVPTTLISLLSWGGVVLVHAVDLSAAGVGKTLLNVSASYKGVIRFQRCKLHSSVAKTTGTLPAVGGVVLQFLDCDSGDTNYTNHYQTGQGIITTETTVKRTGGASDGTTGFCRKMVSNADANVVLHLSEWITFWNETVGSSVAVTVPILTDNVTLKDTEAWIEVEYLGDGSYPIGTIIADRAADILNAGTNQTTDSTSTWTTTGLSTPVKQELSVTFTPQEKGLIRARVCLAKASTTMYYDPKILSTSGRQYQDNGVVNEGAGGGGVIVIED